MNRLRRPIWNDKTGTLVAVFKSARSTGKKSSRGTTELAGTVAKNSNRSLLSLNALTISVMLAFGSNSYALPTGGAVSAGSANIAVSPGNTTITQSSQNVAINWQSFNIGQTEAVRFVQPNSNAVALNRVLGSDPSSILGSLSANGKVFLVNPNGVLFGNGAQVNVGGLVASTRNISDSDFMAGNYKFSGSGSGTIVNQGAINADGGYVALLGAKVSNEGVISARLGTVTLAAGNAFTLDVAGDGLLNVVVNEGAVNALVKNGGLIKADGGQVLLTAQSAGNLLQSVVNNTGVIQAQTVENHNGTIRLMGDMQNGTLNVAGTLDASAPNGGNGGFIETSAAHVKFSNDVQITTAAPTGLTGTWLIDPVDFNIQALGGDITGPVLTALLVNNNVTISTVITGTNTATTFFAAPGQGDINVNDPIGAGASWTAAGATTTLTLNAARDVNINSPITATNGNLVACCGRDVNVRAAITTTNGSVLLSAGRDVTLFAGSAMTTTNGNIELCAGRDVIVNSKITLTDSGSILSQSLGLPLGLTLIAGTGGSGPGVAGGSVYLPGPADPLRPTVTKAGAPATDVAIYYNPTSYATPTNYFTNFILNGGAALTQYMLVFPDGGSKPFDGTTATTFTSLKGNPAGVTLNTGAGVANFDTAAVGVDKTVSYTGFTLTQGPILVATVGSGGSNFALPTTCCGPIVGTTTASITPGVIVLPGGTTLLPGQTVSDLVQMAVGEEILRELSGVNLAVEGIRMPPVQLAAVPPPPVAPVEVPPKMAPIVVPPEIPPPVYVAPPRPPRQDRN